MLKICLVFSESEPQYAYKLYAYKKNMYLLIKLFEITQLLKWRISFLNCDI